MNTTTMVIIGAISTGVGLLITKYIMKRNDLRCEIQRSERLEKRISDLEFELVEYTGLRHTNRSQARMIDELRRELAKSQSELSRNRVMNASNQVNDISNQIRESKTRRDKQRSSGRRTSRDDRHTERYVDDSVSTTCFANSIPTEPVVRESTPSYCSGNSGYSSSDSSSSDSSSSCSSSSSCD